MNSCEPLDELNILRTVEDPIELHIGLRHLLRDILEKALEASDLKFSGPYPQLHYLYIKRKISKATFLLANAFRARAEQLALPELKQKREESIAAIAFLIQELFTVKIPDCWGIAPKTTFLLQQERREIKQTYVRAFVLDWDSTTIRVHLKSYGDKVFKLAYQDGDNNGDRSYLEQLLFPNAQLNLIHPQFNGEHISCELIIFEPDCLLNISAVAACISTYSPLQYLLSKFEPSISHKSYILLGNFAGQLLDEALNQAEKTDYTNSALNFFRKNALSLLAAEDLSTFHKEAKQQKANIGKAIQTIKKDDPFARTDQAILEPSFFCEMLGLQGRMDLLQEDFRLLIEQKAGKWDEWRQTHQEAHYVQMLLYLALLHFNFNIKNADVSCYLLYSKYSEGLRREGPAPRLLERAIKLRNQIVANEYLFSQERGRTMIEQLQVEQLREKVGINEKFWQNYLAPGFQTTLQTIQNASTLAKDYFFRFFRFIEREQLLSHLGSSAQAGDGFSSLWNATLEEKRENGNILEQLKLEGGHKFTPKKGFDQLSLSVTAVNDNYLPNFRKGDKVVVYKYKRETTPDVRKTIVIRAAIEEITNTKITLRLNAPQKNQSVFSTPKGYAWAIEHDLTDASRSLYQGLFSFLQMPSSRRDVLLLQQKPAVRTYQRKGEYGAFNELVEQALSAEDFFLIVGPPGTGKTSFGLMNILQEELLDPSALVLLTAYTNRAVDEICSKLVKANLDFIRIGKSITCEPTYRPYLLEEQLQAANNLTDVSTIIGRHRIFVGTTSTLIANNQLFLLRSFSLAIVDEASQFLEPQLLPLLAAQTRQGQWGIRRFVFIGDHKQLPAIVKQTERQSAVYEQSLRSIGLKDCRDSLFSRLYRAYENDPNLVFHLKKQGRMHPAIADFPGSFFYANLLSPVPCPHQEQSLPYCVYEDPLETIIAQHRVAFFSASPKAQSVSEKTNQTEASFIIHLVKTIKQLYHKNNLPFSKDTIGIIVPYRNQIALIKAQLEDDHTVDTVERYQGSERPIIIYGFTVHRQAQLNFLTANRFEENGALIDRKLNVALTRAKEQLFLVGNPQLLARDKVFRQLLTFCKDKEAYFSADNS